MRLHLSNSTIAGAAGMLAAAQRKCGHEALYFQFSDSGPSRQIFSPDVVVPTHGDEWVAIFRAAVRQASVVHVHNWLPEYFETILIEELSRSRARRVWHLHQGQFERPVYVADDVPNIQWDVRIAVAHAFCRTFDDFVPLPNCVYRESAMWLAPRVIETRPSRAGQLGVVFSPSSGSQARWSKKSDPEFIEAVDSVRFVPGIDLYVAEDEAPNTLLVRRCAGDVTIDELMTGGFHLVSYEGLLAGNVVLNDGDELALETFRAALGADRPPPFIRCHRDRVVETLLGLRDDLARRRSIQADSRKYYEQYLMPARVVDLFEKAYALK